MNDPISTKRRIFNQSSIQGLLSQLKMSSRFVVLLIILMPMTVLADDTEVKEKALDSIDERITAVQSRRVQVQNRLSALPGDGSGAPPEAEADEWAEYRRVLNLIVNSYDSHLDALNKLKTVRVARQDIEAKSKAWLNFAEPGPYTIDFVDDLWNQLRAKERELETVRIEQALYDNLLESRRDSFKNSEQALRKAQEQLDKAESASVNRLQWKQDLVEMQNVHEQARVALLDTENELRNEIVRLRDTEKELLQRQVRVASSASPLTEQDRDAKLAALTQRQQEVGKEIQKAIEIGRILDEQWRQTRDRLQEAQTFSSSLLPEAAEQQQKKLELLQNELKTQMIESEVSSSIIKLLRLLDRILLAHRHIWELRYQVENNPDLKTLEDALAQIEHGYDQIKLWRKFLLSGLDAARRRLDNQEKKLIDWKPEFGDRELGERERLAFWRHDGMYRRLVAEADNLESTLLSFKQSMEMRYKNATVSDRVTKVYKNAGDVAVLIWDFELFTVEDKIVVEGREIINRRSVTVGKIVRILFILAFGLWLIGKISDRGLQSLSNRLPGHESAILLGFRLFTLIAVIAILVFALVRVHIPLTVFTFFGGALAIGVGFGAQNIISNFISGLILLVEQPVKLGDIVDVEGISGKITHIGGRCCQVHRFDGIDMLIPNSSFLDKSVTNWTLSDQSIRCTVTVGVAYGSPVRDALQLLEQAAVEHGLVLNAPAPEVYLEGFGDNTLNLTLDFWVGNLKQINRRRIMSDIRHRIVNLFGERGIEIAFPQRDVHVDSKNPIKVEFVSAEIETPLNLKGLSTGRNEPESIGSA
ncbi:MAG: mechanosensitive ion channel [Gammaproteobacteria bacterium]|nr:mechanosensitive ion channel [Gammaproteobacteria bacterium]